MKELLTSKNWESNLARTSTGYINFLYDKAHGIGRIGVTQNKKDVGRDSEIKNFPFELDLYGFDIESTYHAQRYFKEFFKERHKKGSWFFITPDQFLELKDIYENDYKKAWQESPSRIKYDKMVKSWNKDNVRSPSVPFFQCSHCLKSFLSETDMKEHRHTCPSYVGTHFKYTHFH